MAKGSKAGGGKIVTATELAEHLDCARSYLDKLESSGVIHREPGGGFNLAASRVGFIRHLRRERTTTAKGAEEAAFLKAKRVALEVRTEERLGKLVPVELLNEMIDSITGMYRIELSALPASLTRDVRERRRLEDLIRKMLHRIANEAARRAGNVAESGRTEALGLETTDADA